MRRSERGQSCIRCAGNATFLFYPEYPPPPLCSGHALVQATVGVGTVLIWDLIQFGTKCSDVVQPQDMGLVTNSPVT